MNQKQQMKQVTKPDQTDGLEKKSFIDRAKTGFVSPVSKEKK